MGKKDLLSEFLFEKNIKIFGVSESLLKATTPSAVLNIRGYSFERRDRGKNGGGVCVYIKEGIDYIRRPDLENPETECIWLEIILKHSKSYLIGILYRPPDNSKHLHKNFLEKLSNTLSIIGNSNKETIILGDINANYLDNRNHIPLKQLFQLNGFQQTIKTPTRIEKDSETLIDVILTNASSNLTKSQVVTSSMSDHDMIMCKRKINNIKFSAKTVHCRDYSHYDANTVRNELSHEQWDNIYDTDDPSLAWQNLRAKLTDVIDRHAPNVSKRVKGKSSPWLTKEIKSEMNCCDALRRRYQKTKCDRDHQSYKTKRNKVTNIIRRAKRNYHKELLKETENNPDKFWRTLKNIFPTKDNSSCAKSFLIDGELTTEKEKVASYFCSFFTGIARKLKTKNIMFTNFTWRLPMQLSSKTALKFRLNPVTVNEVFILLKKLSRKKAAGPDNLPPGFLKDIALQIAGPLCHVINTSIKTGIVPQGFKIGKVTPIYKSGPRNSMDNYRPITVLPVCSKIYEKCIYKQLMQFLECNKLLSATQFGFRSGRNTELAVTLFVDEICKNMNEGRLTGAIFIDLSKAFDTLSHSQILANLRAVGVQDKENELFTDYLFNRSQTVSFEGFCSEYQSTTCGVPQGSILGPLLFLIAYDGISNVLQNSKILMYADDTVLLTSAKTQTEIEKALSEDFARAADWLESNELILNMKKGKTEAMLFGTKQRLKGKNINISYRHRVVHSTENYKYLGVDIDKSVNLNEHLNKTYKKVCGRLHLLKRLRGQMTQKAALAIYQTMVIPLLTYCSIITCNNNEPFKKKLVSIENRAERIIFNGAQQAKISSINDEVKKRICCQVFACINNETCDPFKNYFEIMENNTRNKGKLIRLPKANLECFKKSFYFYGAKVFNSLSLKSRSARSKSEFLKQIIKT